MFVKCKYNFAPSPRGGSSSSFPRWNSSTSSRKRKFLPFLFLLRIETHRGEFSSALYPTLIFFSGEHPMI